MAVSPEALAQMMLEALPPGLPPPPLDPRSVSVPPTAVPPPSAPVLEQAPPVQVMPAAPDMGAPVAPEGAPMLPGGIPQQPPGAMPPQMLEQPQEPPTLIPQPIKTQLGKMLNERKLAIAKAIVANYGQPEGTVAVDDIELLKIWRYRNPEVDVQALRAQNLPEGEILDLVYPYRRSLIANGNYTWKDKVAFARRMKQLDDDTLEAFVGEIQYDPKKVPVKLK